MCVSFPIVHWSAFPGDYFSGMSDMFECSNCYGVAGQVSARLEIVHNWPESLAIK